VREEEVVNGTRQRVVVGVDGSAGAGVALAWALAEAARRGARVDVISVVPVDVYWLDPFLLDARRIDAVRADTERLTRQLVDEARRDPVVTAHPGSADLDIRVSVVAGQPAPRLVHHAEGADLLVVGSRGRGAMRSTFGGSVALHCATRARCPVVVVHPGTGAQDAPARVVVGVDDSAPARQALVTAVRQAAGMGASVDAVFAYEGPQVWSGLYGEAALPPAETEQRALERGRQIVDEALGGAWGGGTAGSGGIDIRAIEGPPGEVLLEAAEGARLLVVGTGSRTALEGMLLGSVALICVLNAPCPVLVARGRSEESEPAAAAARSEAAPASVG
jgi:nucleotide-binding universal stress UspA family protein